MHLRTPDSRFGFVPAPSKPATPERTLTPTPSIAATPERTFTGALSRFNKAGTHKWNFVDTHSDSDSDYSRPPRTTREEIADFQAPPCGDEGYDSQGRSDDEMDVTARSPDVDNAEVGHDDVYDAVDRADYNHGSRSEDNNDGKSFYLSALGHDDVYHAVDHADYNHGSGSEDNDDGKSFYLSASVVLLTF